MCWLLVVVGSGDWLSRKNSAHCWTVSTGVYLDDIGVNLKPARDMGMTTIKVTGAAQAITELEATTGLALRG